MIAKIKSFSILVFILTFIIAAFFVATSIKDGAKTDPERSRYNASFSQSSNNIIYKGESPAVANDDKYLGGAGDFFHTYYINTKEPFPWYQLEMISPYLRQTAAGGFSSKLKEMDYLYNKIIEGGEGSFQRRDAEESWNELVDIFINDHENSRLLKRRYIAKLNENISFYNLTDGGFRIQSLNGINTGSTIVSVNIVTRNVFLDSFTESDIMFNLAFVDAPEVIKTDDHDLARKIESLIRTADLDIEIYGGATKIFRTLKLDLYPTDRKRVIVLKTHKVKLLDRKTGDILLSTETNF